MVNKVRVMGLCGPVLVAVDGLPSYVNAFRSKMPRHGREGTVNGGGSLN